MRIHRFLLGLALSVSAASAQRPVAAPAGATRPAVVAARPELSQHVRASTAVRPSRARRAAIGAVVGGVLGAGVGAAVASERVHRSGVTDHSEDGLVYFVFVSGGAAAGLVVGTVAGLAWPK